mmetsp:Transcript_104150/g.127240  ORF Transcript_104150/g.127240 Transcript_104150/m.127240 type:complete len:502 (-) Transcript_104150:47-1552(-)
MAELKHENNAKIRDKWDPKILINGDMSNVVTCFECGLISGNVYSNDNGTNIYCKECGQTLLNENRIKKMIKNVAFSNMISNLKCRCPNSCFDEKNNDINEGILITNNAITCGWNGKFSGITNHINTECHLTKRSCKYIKIGCDRKNGMNRMELNNHYKIYRNNHENMLIDKVSECLGIIKKQNIEISQFNQVITQQNDKILQLNQVITDFDKIIVDQNVKIAKLNDTINDQQNEIKTLNTDIQFLKRKADQEIKVNELQTVNTIFSFDPIKKHSGIKLSQNNRAMETNENNALCVLKTSFTKRNYIIRLRICNLTIKDDNDISIGLIESMKIKNWSPSTIVFKSDGFVTNAWSTNKVSTFDNEQIMDYTPKHSDLKINQIIQCLETKFDKKNYYVKIIEKNNEGIKIHWIGYNKTFDEYIPIKHYDRIKLCSVLPYGTNDVITIKYKYNTTNDSSTIQWCINHNNTIKNTKEYPINSNTEYKLGVYTRFNYGPGFVKIEIV